MAKAKSKTSQKAKPSTPGRAKPSATQQPTKKAARSLSSRSTGLTPLPDTKHAKILAMLRSTGGATIAAMMKATGWQQHSVRGFLAGVVRKRLELNLVSEKTDKGRIYRIKERRSRTDREGVTKQAA